MTDLERRSDTIKEYLKTTEFFFVGIFAFIIIAISILLMIYIPTASKNVNEYAQATISNASMVNAVAASEYFADGISFLNAASSEFVGITLDDSVKLSELCKKIADCGEFRHVGFTNVDGLTFSSLGLSTNTSNRAFVHQGLEGKTTVMSHVPCDFDGKICDMFTVPVRDKAGTIIGALTGDMPLMDMSRVLLLSITGKRNGFYILDSDGDVVYSTNDDIFGQKEGDRLTDLIADKITANDISYLLNSVTDSSVKKIKINDKEYLASFTAIADRGWTFVAFAPTDEVYSAFGLLIGYTIGLVIIMSSLLLFALAIVSARLSRVRKEVSEAVDESFKIIYTDSITGHQTIDGFRQEFAVAMKDTATRRVLISIDIDRFKAVNDMFGFDGGNEIIRKFSDIIKRNIGKNDSFARASGDLFYILVEYSSDKDITDLLQRIISDVEYQISAVKLSLSAGIYRLEDSNIRSRVAADRADMAREMLKGDKKSSFMFFDNSMLKKIRSEKHIEDIMEDALALGEFIVYLQPKFRLDGENEIVGAEALVRWKHDGELIPPGDFIPLFERNGFVTKIDYYMFEEVCKLQKKYKEMGYEPKIISVNMSRLHIHNPDFVSGLAKICEKYAIDTKYLEIEITESAAYEDMEILCDIFSQIKSFGFHVSIDDFGTGYSSLNMLKDLPVDVLKIDRSFLTENADEHENASLIIGCVVALASSLEIRTICEGIETREQALLLAKLGCNMAQGFFFARPMPVPEYEKLAYGMEDKKKK